MSGQTQTLYKSAAPRRRRSSRRQMVIERQRQVVAYRRAGLLQREIAARLGVSPMQVSRDLRAERIS